MAAEPEPSGGLGEQLLDAAEALLSEREVGAITAREIARVADVSDGVLYNYFADKNELLLTAFVRRFAGLVERLEKAMPEPGTRTVAANLRIVARAVYDVHADSFPIVWSLLAEKTLLHRFVHAIHSADEPFGGRQIRDAVVGYVAGEQELGRLHAPDPGAAADLLIGGSAALALGNVVLHLGGEPERRLSDLVDTLIRGLGPQRS